MKDISTFICGIKHVHPPSAHWGRLHFFSGIGRMLIISDDDNVLVMSSSDVRPASGHASFRTLSDAHCLLRLWSSSCRQLVIHLPMACPSWSGGGYHDSPTQFGGHLSPIFHPSISTSPMLIRMHLSDMLPVNLSLLLLPRLPRLGIGAWKFLFCWNWIWADVVNFVEIHKSSSAVTVKTSRHDGQRDHVVPSPPPKEVVTAD